MRPTRSQTSWSGDTAVDSNVAQTTSLSSAAETLYDAYELPGTTKIGRILHYGVGTHTAEAEYINEHGKPQSVIVEVLTFVKGHWIDIDKGAAIESMHRDILQWTKLHHPNIVGYMGYQWDHSPTDPCLVSEWFQRKSLPTYLKQNPTADKISLLTDVASGLTYLHSQTPPVLQGHLKPQNILVSESGHAMLSNFGLAPYIDAFAVSVTQNAEDLVPIGYGAPEVLESSEYNTKTDVYAFGSLMLELLSGHRPFYKLKLLTAIMIISKGDVPDKADHPGCPSTSSYWSIMNKCWEFKPKNRPTMPEVLDMFRCGSATPPQLDGMWGALWGVYDYAMSYNPFR